MDQSDTFTTVTNGIRVTVRSRYEPNHSLPQRDQYVFSYAILIENDSDITVQLLRRHWYIYDSLLSKREVEGEGVIGQQPTIAPGESYTYSSWCPFSSEIGMMKGHFEMISKSDQKHFIATVPSFTMMALGRRN